MADLDKVYEHILDQFSDVPNWQKYYTVFCDLTDELRQMAMEWHSHRYLETAEGNELDVCGVRIGLPRPNAWLDDGVFTWDSTETDECWDAGVWSGDRGIQTSELLGDDEYRALLRAKAYANGAGSSLFDVATTINLMFDIDYTVETYAEREVRIVFSDTVTEFQRFYVRAIVPIQLDTDLVLI